MSITRKHKRHIAKWLMRRPFVRLVVGGCSMSRCGLGAKGAIMRLIKDRMSLEMWLVFSPEE